jgi:hypothetical protein
MVAAGQNVSYILQQGPSGETVLPSDLIDGPVQYDVEKYTQLILDAVTGMFSPLGYDRSALQETILAQKHTS